MGKEIDGEEIMPFDGDEKDTMYKYQCYECRYEEYIPNFIVDETARMINFLKEDSKKPKSKRMPIMVCPSCDTDFYYTGEKK